MYCHRSNQFEPIKNFQFIFPKKNCSVFAYFTQKYYLHEFLLQTLPVSRCFTLELCFPGHCPAKPSVLTTVLAPLLCRRHLRQRESVAAARRVARHERHCSSEDRILEQRRRTVQTLTEDAKLGWLQRSWCAMLEIWIFLDTTINIKFILQIHLLHYPWTLNSNKLKLFLKSPSDPMIMSERKSLSIVYCTVIQYRFYRNIHLCILCSF